MITDEIADDLEAKGLYRRAADRWLELLMACSLPYSTQEAIVRNRSRCINLAKRTNSSASGYTDVRKAANKVIYDMGLSQPNGNAFRKTKKKAKPSCSGNI